MPPKSPGYTLRTKSEGGIPLWQNHLGCFLGATKDDPAWENIESHNPIISMNMMNDDEYYFH